MDDEEDLFLSEQHPTTERWAILEDDGVSAWLYVTEPASEAPVGDCFVYNRVPAIPDAEVRQYASEGHAPPASVSYASDVAQLADPARHAITVEWSDDGTEARVLIDGRAWAALRVGEPRGRSRGLKAAGPFGDPW